MTHEQAPIHVHVETDRFILRSLSEQDASPRWAEWLNDRRSAAMLNVPTRVVSVQELQALIGKIDQYEKLLLGIFVLGSNMHIGVIRLWFINERTRMVPGVLIGEPEWRNVGVLHEVANAVGSYFFETFDLQAIVASVPTHDHYMKRYLEEREWKLVRQVPGKKLFESHQPSDLLVYELSRATWLDRKRRGFFGGQKPPAQA